MDQMNVRADSDHISLAGASRTRLDWAQWMAHKGIGAFIVTPGSKRPLEGRSWYLRQTTDPDVLEKWFEEIEDCNYGLHLGAEYVVIDLDLKPDVNGVTAFEEICRENGVDDFTLNLDTLMVRTPGGGYHLYFKAPFPCSNKNTFPDGIDVRGIQGYVVGPGSKDSRGEWEVIDTGADIMELPEWLEDYVVEPGYKDPNRNVPVIEELDQPQDIEYAKEWLKNRAPAVEGQNGDNWTYETCQYIRDFGISEAKALEVMAEWNSRCAPPWDPAELEAKITNAYEYGQNRPGCKSLTFKMQRLTEAQAQMRAYDNLTPQQKAELRRVGALAVGNVVFRHHLCPGITDDMVPDVDDYPASSANVNDAEEDLFPAYLVGELDQIPDPVWLIQDVLPEGSLGMTYGGTGSLKTFLELDKALWGAVGEPWAANEHHDLEGFKIMRPLRTVIVAGEGARGLKRRIKAWARRHGIETNDLPILVIPVMPRFADEGDLDKLVRTIKAKLPNPDYIIVDTAMWAASGLNLNVPADSQVLLSSFKRVMLGLKCSLTFVHHTGKDKKREQLGAENLIAGVDVADRIDLEEKGTGYRRIKVTNKKMKDAELREPVSMEAHPETVGTDEDGREFGSLVLQRCQKSAKAEAEADPRLNLAMEIIAENKGKTALNMSELAEKMTRRGNSEDLSDGELERAKEGMRSYLRKAARRELSAFAHKASKAKHAQWVFEDRAKDSSAA